MTSGKKSSCGCLKSKGESKIQQLLQENNIPFQTQKTFETCIFPDTNRKALFDFYVDNKYIIEYNREQHYGYRNIGWSNETQFNKTVEHDKFKENWCKENNIPLIVIPYWKFNTLSIQDLMIKGEKENGS